MFLIKNRLIFIIKDTEWDTSNKKPPDNQRVFVAPPGIEPESKV